MRYSYRPRGVCPMEINFDLNGNVVRNIEFTGGCNGNLKAISKLVDGMTVEQIEERSRGRTPRRIARSAATAAWTALKNGWTGFRQRMTPYMAGCITAACAEKCRKGADAPAVCFRLTLTRK